MSQLRKLAPECMVLLKSDGAFPLEKPCSIALYGNGARNTIKGGTGSGDVNVKEFVTVEMGLENAGFTVTTDLWLSDYEKLHEEAHQKFVDEIKAEAHEKGIPAIMLGFGAMMPEPEYDLPLYGNGDAALYVLSRNSGEGTDRKPIKGDLLLNDSEVRDILELNEKYKKFMLVLNVGGVVDLTPVQEVRNILLLSQLGMTIGDSLADVLLGTSCPSGKLTDTWAAADDYCTVGEFGEKDDTRYNEGIYVGYRYFDSVGKEPLYPFGYGLSYTTFEWKQPIFSLKGTQVEVSANVTNTGTFSGKEVLQLYVSVPAGKLDQPYQILAAFAKTEELAPGAQTRVKMSFSLTDIASYDTETARRILEPGDYVLRLGTSSRETEVIGVLELKDTIKAEQLRNAGGTPDFQDWKPEPLPVQREKDAIRIPVTASDFSSAEPEALSKEDVRMQKAMLDKVQSLSDEELIHLCVGAFQDEKSKSVIGAAAFSVAGAAGESTNTLEEKGIPAFVMADGPAGVRISPRYGVDEQGIYELESAMPQAILDFVDENVLRALHAGSTEKVERHGEEFEQWCTAIPVGTALAQSWNPELCELCGDIVGTEMERYHVQLWLAPALNIHRNPLCGRNFEYYSEDPLISGKMAAAVVKGVQKHPGCGTTIKHYCCNNQETNRFRNNSIVSERALREIYLRGFEICVKDSAPTAVMTSYNLLNGEHTSFRKDLNIQVLREEWGFRGLVVSDWVTTMGAVLPSKYEYACASGSVKGGNDLFMPGGPADIEDLQKALADDRHPYHITREDLEFCASHVIRAAWTLCQTGNEAIK